MLSLANTKKKKKVGEVGTRNSLPGAEEALDKGATPLQEVDNEKRW